MLTVSGVIDRLSVVFSTVFLSDEANETGP